MFLDKMAEKIYLFTNGTNNYSCAVESESDWASALSSGPLWKVSKLPLQSMHMCTRVAQMAAMDLKGDFSVMLHNGGFCKNCMPNRCLHTCQCISKQMHYKTPFSHKGYMKSLEFYGNYITLFCLEKQTFWDIILTQHPWHNTQSGWNNFLV